VWLAGSTWPGLLQEDLDLTIAAYDRCLDDEHDSTRNQGIELSQDVK